MALASSYTVSGAGTSAANGVYTPNGSTYNGVAVYENPSGKLLYVSHPPFPSRYMWIINTGFYNNNGNYYNNTNSTSTSTLANPDSGTWSMGGNGSSPAPTVTAGGSAGNHTNAFFGFF